ncbi:LOW QUALITY PROTEIN: SKA complex subunit 3 [Diretmus argenteus]
MDPTSRFFTKLRELSITLETETAKLQQDYQTRDDDDSENTQRATRTYHELNSEVRDFKGQIQDQLAQQRAKEDEMSRFLKACTVMEQRIAQDIQRMKEHCENYGYQAPKDTHKLTKVKGQESEATHEGAEVEEEEGNQSREEVGLDLPSMSPPRMGLPPSTDPLRTPQLSDFGLSEMYLKRKMAGAAFYEVPPMPEMSLPHPSLYMPVQPPMPITPKCNLRMEDELQMPQMHDFGISDHTMCLNNDFTMDLHRKRPSQNPPTPLVMDNLCTKAARMETPEPPEFYTPWLKITKSNGHSSPPPPEDGDPESPGRPSNLLTTPEVPAFQTPYINRLLSSRRKTVRVSKEFNEGATGAREPSIPNLDLDGPTQEFSLSLRTPHFRRGDREPSTPEMPDLSSVTQDICKLVSQTQLKKTTVAAGQPHPRPSGKENRAKSLSVVSESEFQSLPQYLRQMSLSSLNQTVHKINTPLQGREEFLMEELQKITCVGTKAPIYILCLTELKRLERVHGVESSSVYKLLSHN